MLSLRVDYMVVPRNRGTPNIDPKILYGDPHKGTLNFGKPAYSISAIFLQVWTQRDTCASTDEIPYRPSHVPYTMV